MTGQEDGKAAGRPAGPPDAGARLVRNPAVTETPLDDEVFLVEPDSDEVYYLDPVSSGLWRLLAMPATLAELQAAYRAAFPDNDGATIDRDVAAAVAEMRERGLVVVFG
jgi:hypothetical protein